VYDRGYSTRTQRLKHAGSLLYLPYARMASDATCASVLPCASAIFCSSANAASFTITRGMRDTDVVGTGGTTGLWIATGAACTSLTHTTNS
jgi:hypothetical protein